MASIGMWVQDIKDMGSDEIKQHLAAINALMHWPLASAEIGGLRQVELMLEGELRQRERDGLTDTTEYWIVHESVARDGQLHQARDAALRVRGFRVSYEVITPESAESGDAADAGIEDDFISMEPDAYDAEEGLTAVDRAIEYLRDNAGADGLEPSSSGMPLSVQDWWTAYKTDEDLATGAVTNLSYHPHGWTTQEINQINRGLGLAR